MDGSSGHGTNIRYPEQPQGEDERIPLPPHETIPVHKRNHGPGFSFERHHNPVKILPQYSVPPGYRAFFRSMATRALHRGHWTFTGRFDRFRLASRIPMYVHAWLQRWQVRRQLVYWLCMSSRCLAEDINPVRANRESGNPKKSIPPGELPRPAMTEIPGFFPEPDPDSPFTDLS